MKILSGHSQGNVLVVHGGAASQGQETEKMIRAARVLLAIAGDCLPDLALREPIDVVVRTLQLLEDDPQFNAGLGASIQSDGQIRISASLMDGDRQSFSGVINALRVKHPSAIARALQEKRSRVISQPGIQTLAKDLNLPEEDLATEERLQDWRTRSAVGGFDTVGCVVRNAAGHVAAGTSTGGRSFEFPGRVSDSATVAGNYASAIAAISATGVGEEIVDDALAARIETRCRDGMSLEQAVRRCYDEAAARARHYGWIAVHQNGDWAIAHTTPSMSFAVRDERGVLASSDSSGPAES